MKDKKEIIELIENDIKWHKTAERTMPDDWCDGFIRGLKQAIILINKI